MGTMVMTWKNWRIAAIIQHRAAGADLRGATLSRRCAQIAIFAARSTRVTGGMAVNMRAEGGARQE
jgi:hypothetical protein